MTIHEVLPSVASLSDAEKFQRVQSVPRPTAEEEGIPSQPAPANDFDPRRYFGAAQHTRQAVDDYLATARESWS